jgi:hypothetical protein
MCKKVLPAANSKPSWLRGALLLITSIFQEVQVKPSFCWASHVFAQCVNMSGEQQWYSTPSSGTDSHRSEILLALNEDPLNTSLLVPLKPFIRLEMVLHTCVAL